MSAEIRNMPNQNQAPQQLPPHHQQAAMQAAFSTLMEQRDNAMNVCADMRGQLAVASLVQKEQEEQIKSLSQRLVDAQMEISKMQPSAGVRELPVEVK